MPPHICPVHQHGPGPTCGSSSVPSRRRATRSGPTNPPADNRPHPDGLPTNIRTRQPDVQSNGILFLQPWNNHALHIKAHGDTSSMDRAPQIISPPSSAFSSAGLHLQYSSKNANSSTPLYKPPFPRQTAALKRSNTVIS